MNVKSGKFRVIIAIAAFVTTMVLFIFVFAPIQMKFGMWGLAATEIGILVLSVGFALASRRSIGEIFPFSVPKPRQILGTLVLWIASYISVLLVSLITMYFFPAMAEVSTAMSEFFNSVPFILTVVIAAFLPAFCEEALHRGLIFSSLDVMRKGWVRVLVMGLVFGLFHLDPYRFLTTAMLGAMLSFIMLRTNNLWLPVLLHFVNNFVSTAAGAVSGGSDAVAAAQTQMSGDHLLASVGSFMVISVIVPFLLLLGSKLIGARTKPAEEQAGEDIAVKPKKISPVLICAIIAVLQFVAGAAIVVSVTPNVIDTYNYNLT